jgi:hypothetical protein
MMRASLPKKRKIIPITELNYSEGRQQRIRSLVTKLRHARGKTNTKNSNLHFRSTTNKSEDLDKLSDLLTDPLYKALPFFSFPKVNAARLLLRFRPNISSEYSKSQTLHIDAMDNPTEGIVFAQFIYYIDTPQMGGRNAPEKEAGNLLLNPVSPSGRLNAFNTRIVQPKKGRIVFFDPSTTLHEVIAPKGQNTRDVSRNMVIGILYGAPTKNTKQLYSNAGAQIRPSNRYTQTVRAQAGTLRPKLRTNNATINSLIKTMTRTKVSVGLKRKRTTTGTPSPSAKRARKVL